MKTSIILFLSCLLVVAATTDVHAQSRKKKEQQRIEQEKKDKEKEKAKKDSIAKITPYDRLIKDPQKAVKGLMNLYSIKGKLYLEVPMKLMGKDLLLASTISEISDNYEGVVGSKPAPMQVQFTKVDSALLLRKIATDAIAPQNDRNIRQALEKNSIGAIIKVFPVQAYNNDRTAVVIDVTDYFLGDIKDLSPFGIFSLYGAYGLKSTQSFKRDRSFIGDIKAFDDNVLIKSHLSYENTLSDGKRTYVKDKPFTAVMTRAFVLLSEDPVRPRIADSRIGIFTTEKYRLSNEVNRAEPVFFANRWRLEPKDPPAYKRGELVEPVKPITFYVDSDFPESWKQPIKEAIEDWKITFEKIGFKNAIVALDYPKNDTAFDPDNIKYNCIRYAPSPVANAMGPSWVDPRTGEIINASVYVFHDIVKLLNNWIFIQTAPADKAVRNVALPETYKKEGIKYVVRHEIGHCLGFMHNMSASSSIPVDSLRSPSFTQKYGTTFSIMDYARFNYIAQPGDLERGVKLSPPSFGVYDYYLVQWNYSYFGNNVSAEEEKKQLAAMIASKAGDLKFRYGKQQFGAFDPSSQNEDLGDDAVAASVYGIKNLKYIMQHLNSWVGAQDKDYTYRQDIWNGIVNQYVRYINHVYANIGGFYLNEKYEGDPRPSYEAVSRKKQEKALQFLVNELTDLDWLEDRQVLENLTLTGSPAGILRSQLIDALITVPVKLHLASQKSMEAKPYTSKEAMKYIYDLVWNKTLKNKIPGKTERELQKAYVQAVIKNAKLIAPSTGGAQAAAITDLFHGIQLPGAATKTAIEGCGHPAHHATVNPLDPVAGFGYFYTISFSLMPQFESLYFGQLTETKKLLQTAIPQTADKETLMHYKLLLHQIDKALK